MPDVLIYNNINEYSAASFITNINDIVAKEANADIDVLINTNGGSPESGWGMIAKFQQLQNKKSVTNHGKAYSMGLYFNCYVEESAALDVTQFLLHRAAYAEWIESNPDFFTDSMRKNLENINKALRTALEAKIDVDKFNNLKTVKDLGITLDDVFAMDKRIDVPLTAKEAKQIGLINKIIPITPKIKSEIESNFEIAASYEGDKPKTDSKTTKQIKPVKNNNMEELTLEEIKAQYPKLYAQILAMGVNQERDRVGSIMAFAEIDPVGVKAAIESGKPLTETQRSEFFVKAMKKEKLEDVKADSTQAVNTPEVKDLTPEAAKEKADNESFLADVKAGK